jgi:hypothetical protein
MDTGVFAGVWRRSTLEEQAGWDEGWPANQDSELAARVLAGGGRIVCLAELGARYLPRESLAGLARQYWRYGFYRAKTARRHRQSLRRSHLLVPAPALALLGGALGPRLVRRMSQRAVLAYALCLLAVSAGTGARRRDPDAVALPVVFATMHVAWGLGFLAGCQRFGVPRSAIAAALRGSA